MILRGENVIFRTSGVSLSLPSFHSLMPQDDNNYLLLCSLLLCSLRLSYRLHLRLSFGATPHNWSPTLLTTDCYFSFRAIQSCSASTNTTIATCGQKCRLLYSALAGTTTASSSTKTARCSATLNRTARWTNALPVRFDRRQSTTRDRGMEFKQ